jgi:Cu(I)/Ag(I) efflux system membrane fusion protein
MSSRYLIAALLWAGCRGAVDSRPAALAPSDATVAQPGATVAQPGATVTPPGATVALTALRGETVRPELPVLGVVGYDTRLIHTISARVSGRIEKLYVRYRFQHVHAGMRIMDLYSPGLATMEQDLLYLLTNDPGNETMIAAARQRLLLLGVSAEELAGVERTRRASATLGVYSHYTGHIHEAGNTMPDDGAATGGAAYGSSMAVAGVSGDAAGVPVASGMTEELPVKEGMYITQGQTVFQVFNMDRSWALLKVFPGDAALVRKGDQVHLVPETAPDRPFDGTVDEVLPVFGRDEKTLTVRVYFDNSARDLPIGSLVKAVIDPGPVTGNWLPVSAVLSLGLDKVVYVLNDGRFSAHKVTTGATYKDQVQVLSGLTPADSVAANAQFLTDSEDFVKVQH